MMIQGELFELFEKVYEEGLVCIKCDIRQPIENFYRAGLHVNEIKRTCKSCYAGNRKVVEELRFQHPYPDENYSCPICTRTIEEVNKYNQKTLGTWVLDHCHDTDTFRGYICKHCNTGLGGFREKLDTVKSAVRYLEVHKEKLNESNT